jgi:RimJ/RimL family protein N-acetyltransferase
LAITLRTLTDSDLDSLFIWESDPRAVQMAAFTRANPSDRSEFDAHYERVRNDPSATLLAIDDDAEFVGTVASFTMEGEREVSYWIDPARWGQGLASRALRAFLAIEPTRPIYGRVAHHNAPSAKVLARAGFVEVGSETAFAPGVGAEIAERIYRLDH